MSAEEHKARVETAKAALQQAGASASARRLSVLVRQLLPEIEAAASAGTTIKDMVGALRSAGFEIKIETFKKNLYRARKREKERGSRKGGSVAVAKASTAIAATGGATRTTAASPGAQGSPSKGKRLELAPSPKRTFEWDPLERPIIEFIDEEEKPDGNDNEKP